MIHDKTVEHALAEAWDAGAKLQHEIEQAKLTGAPIPGRIFNPYRTQE